MDLSNQRSKWPNSPRLLLYVILNLKKIFKKIWEKLEFSLKHDSSMFIFQFKKWPSCTMLVQFKFSGTKAQPVKKSQVPISPPINVTTVKRNQKRLLQLLNCKLTDHRFKQITEYMFSIYTTYCIHHIYWLKFHHQTKRRKKTVTQHMHFLPPANILYQYWKKSAAWCDEKDGEE